MELLGLKRQNRQETWERREWLFSVSPNVLSRFRLLGFQGTCPSNLNSIWIRYTVGGDRRRMFGINTPLEYVVSMYIATQLRPRTPGSFPLISTNRRWLWSIWLFGVAHKILAKELRGWVPEIAVRHRGFEPRPLTCILLGSGTVRRVKCQTVRITLLELPLAAVLVHRLGQGPKLGLQHLESLGTNASFGEYSGI